MKEIKSGETEFDPEKGHFTMRELFLDVMYRMYAESFVQMLNVGEEIVKDKLADFKARHGADEENSK